MNKILKKIKKSLSFIIISFVMIYDKFALIYRNRKLAMLSQKHDENPNVELMKTEAVFREYLIDPEINTTDDIAAFYSIGVGQELVKKTIKQKPSKFLRRIGRYDVEDAAQMYEDLEWLFGPYAKSVRRKNGVDIVDLLVDPPKQKL